MMASVKTCFSSLFTGLPSIATSVAGECPPFGQPQAQPSERMSPHLTVESGRYTNWRLAGQINRNIADPGCRNGQCRGRIFLNNARGPAKPPAVLSARKSASFLGPRGGTLAAGRFAFGRQLALMRRKTGAHAPALAALDASTEFLHV